MCCGHNDDACRETRFWSERVNVARCTARLHHFYTTIPDPPDPPTPPTMRPTTARNRAPYRCIIAMATPACMLAARGVRAVCEDEQSNCAELLGVGYACDMNLHDLSPTMPDGVTLHALCCHSCETAAPAPLPRPPPPPTPAPLLPPPPPTAPCTDAVICDTPVGDDYSCDYDMSHFMDNLAPGTTLATLCPQKCDVPACREQPTLDLLTFPPAAAQADCADDMHWGTEHGDCSTYAPGQPNAAYCQRDGAEQHCLISCGVCTGGNSACWLAGFSFRRCCGGGSGGDPSCFDGAFAFEACCVDTSGTPQEDPTPAVASATPVVAYRRLCDGCDDCVGCRVDPADGNQYTREEFVAQYGGTIEWDAAAAAAAPPSAAVVVDDGTPVVVAVTDLEVECHDVQQAALVRCVEDCAHCELANTKLALGDCTADGGVQATAIIIETCGPTDDVPPVSVTSSIASPTLIEQPSDKPPISEQNSGSGNDVPTVSFFSEPKFVAGAIFSVAVLVLAYICIRSWCQPKTEAKTSIYTGPDELYSGSASSDDQPSFDVEAVVNPSRTSRLPSEIETV